jgi:hypothetical protein
MFSGIILSWSRGGGRTDTQEVNRNPTVNEKNFSKKLAKTP